MAAKGTESKAKIIEKLLATFDGAFTCDGGKEIRIPMVEGGETVQIKVALTCAKVNVEPAGGAPTEASAPKTFSGSFEITPEEKEEVANLIDKLNL